jgi:outer membrane immunogenic protein
MKIHVAAAAAVSLLAAPAFAGGFAEPIAPPAVTPAPIVPVVPVAPSGDWTGAYVGGQLSYGNVGVSADDTDFDETYSGTLYGLHAGYNYDFGRVVAGVEAAYDWANVDLGGDAAPVAGSLDSVARVGARVGYDAGRVLPFATAGWTRANISGSGAADGVNESYDGWYAGAGVDYAVTDRITVGGQVLYHDFNVDQFDGAEVEGINSNLTTVGVRASFRF